MLSCFLKSKEANTTPPAKTHKIACFFFNVIVLPLFIPWTWAKTNLSTVIVECAVVGHQTTSGLHFGTFANTFCNQIRVFASLICSYLKFTSRSEICLAYLLAWARCLKSTCIFSMMLMLVTARGLLQKLLVFIFPEVVLGEFAALI